MTPTRLAPESPTPVHTFKLAPSGQLAGLVTGVHDGDTINLLLEDRVLVKIRLKGIDAPELRQDFGSEARANLSRIILGKRVEVVYEKIDHYRRPVGTIILDGQDINVVQIDEGMAWHFKRYEYEQPDKERLHYAAAEVRARELRKGLWTLEDPMPPWIYRDRNRLGH